MCSISCNTTWQVLVPAQLSSWEEEDIVESLISRAHLIDASETTTPSVKDDISWLQRCITFSRNYDSNLSVCCTREIVATFVTIFIKAEKDSTILSWIQISCQLDGLLV